MAERDRKRRQASRKLRPIRERGQEPHVARAHALCLATPLLVGSVTNAGTRPGRNSDSGLIASAKIRKAAVEITSISRWKWRLRRVSSTRPTSSVLRDPRALPVTRDYLAEQALEMLQRARFWFTQLTLIDGAPLVGDAGSGTSADDTAGRRGNRGNAAQRQADGMARIRKDRGPLAGGGEERKHPFVAEAGRLAVEALKTRQPERFLWIDESGVVSRLCSRAAQAARDRSTTGSRRWRLGGT